LWLSPTMSWALFMALLEACLKLSRDDRIVLPSFWFMALRLGLEQLLVLFSFVEQWIVLEWLDRLKTRWSEFNRYYYTSCSMV
jgi:hypothetical protein